MKTYDLDLSDSYSFEPENFTAKEMALWERLPTEYRDFISVHNGGFVGSKKCSFKTNIERSLDGKCVNDSSNDLEELFGFISYENAQPESEKPRSVLHEHFNRHIKEGFLPSDVYVIGYCGGSCLLAVSLNDNDFGSIYYWEWYWQYPWFEPFFKRRIKQARSQFDNVDSIVADKEHPQYEAAFNALNYSTIVKVGESFSSFIQWLYEEAPITEQDLAGVKVLVSPPEVRE